MHYAAPLLSHPLEDDERGAAAPGGAVSPAPDRYRAIADALPTLTFETDAAGQRLWSSAGWERYTGLSAQELSGRGWVRVVHAQDMRAGHADWQRNLQAGRAHASRRRVRRYDGQWRWHLVNVVPRLDGDGTLRGWLGSAVDVDEMVRAEQALAAQEQRASFMLAVSEALRDLAQPQDMMDAATAALGRHLDVAQVGYGEIDGNPPYITVHHDWNDGRIPSVVGRWRLPDFGVAFVDDIRAGRTVAIADVEEDDRTRAPAVVAAYAGIHTRSILDVPLVKHGRLVALLFIHHPEPRGWSDVDIALAEQVCERLWGAVERGRAERARDASEAHLRAVLDALPVGVVIAEAPSGRIVKGNRSIEDILGHPLLNVEGVAGYAEYGAFHEDGRPVAPAEQPLARVLAGEERPALEMRYLRPGGHMAWLRALGAPIRDADGTLTGALVVVDDIDAKVRALESLQERERQLAQAQLRLDLALSAGDMGVWEWSPAQGRSHWNRQMFELLGLKPTEDGFLPTAAFMARVHPGDRPALEGALAKALATRGGFEQEMRLAHADGRQVWLLNRGEVVCDGCGHVERMVGVSLDITAQKAAQAALTEALQAKDTLLYEVHHRVKNNLQIINSLLSLQLRTVQDEDARRAIAEAGARVGVMARLHLSLYQSGRLGSLDLGHWLRRMAEDTLRLLGEGKHITLDFQSGEAVTLAVDQAVPLSLLLSELLTNAVKYAFPNGRGTVRLHVHRKDGGLRLLVADDGVGLPEGFEPAASKGLGMRIIHALARQIDAQLTLLERGAGTAFRIDLPLPPAA
ncbi:PAS domain S-box protein [Azohydromonas lata]|uniref:histidine kinase n=1 Tax=Azohydromonas lata TaxID=45677 RepID=A0ABU5ILT1_9BURK|nr:PAS domain S-box protein [Azohydromonas lata]MDZ5459873.1 PAS domain S-box protein [Azohydromonas lata]